MNKTIIIAEAGVNHNGSIERALQMVKSAAEAGADYIKFQTFRAQALVTANAPKAAYQKKNAPDTDTQMQMLRQLELSDKEFIMLAKACDDHGIGFMSTPFDIDSADMLADLGMDYWKIPSGEITNLPLLRHIGKMNRNIIMSTGMCTVNDIKAAIDVIAAAGTARDNIILLHCTTQYPAPISSVNLRAMESLRALGCRAVGYSDHTQGITVPLAAVAMGAAVIEKHFTLDRNLPGPDHRASLEPDELAEMVRGIRTIELALGSSEKTVTEAESPNIAIARKSIVASRPINKGEILSADNLTVKRPGTGLSPMMWDRVIGSHACRDFSTDEQIEI